MGHNHTTISNTYTKKTHLKIGDETKELKYMGIHTSPLHTSKNEFTHRLNESTKSLK